MKRVAMFLLSACCASAADFALQAQFDYLMDKPAKLMSTMANLPHRSVMGELAGFKPGPPPDMIRTSQRWIGR